MGIKPIFRSQPYLSISVRHVELSMKTWMLKGPVMEYMS
jgi:hypothetical protein